MLNKSRTKSQTIAPIGVLLGKRSLRRINWRSRSIVESFHFYIFIAPWLIGWVVLSIVPLVLGFVISLSNYNGFNWDTAKFVGAANYARALGDQEVWASLERIVSFSVANVLVGLFLPLLLAVLLNTNIKVKGIFRTIFYIPTLVPVVAGAFIMKIFLDKNFGLVNAGLSLARPGTALPWLTDLAPLSLMLFVQWLTAGSAMLIFFSGLQGISKEVKEAAIMDGAGPWTTFWKITLPLLSPLVFFQLIIGVVTSLQIMVQPMVLLATQGTGQIGTPPTESTYMYLVYTFIQIFGQGRFAYGTALLWIFFVVVLLITLALFRTSRYWVHYEVEQ